MAQPLRFGVAGIGNEGRAIVPYLEATENILFSAAADLREDALDALQEAHPQIKTFTSVVAMCQSGEVDAIWIATPNPVHAEHAIAAADAGIHVVLEKPMAISLDQTHQMVEAVERNGTRLMLHSHASDPPIVKMREIIASGRLGRLIGISALQYKAWLNSPRLAFELDTSLGGGVIFRQGPHQIEIARHLGGGLVKSVRAYTGRWHPTFQTEGNYSALLEFADGTPASLVLHGYGYFIATDLTWNIGEGGTAGSGEYRARPRRLEPIEPATYYATGGRAGTRSGTPRPESGREIGAQSSRMQPIYGLFIVSCENGEMRQSPNGIYVYTDDGCEEVICEPFQDKAHELQVMYESVRENKPLFPDARWGRATLEVILAILESGRTHRDVTLEYQVPSPI